MTWRNTSFIAAFILGTIAARADDGVNSAISTYGHRNSHAPTQLEAFSFLVGKWHGSGKTRLATGGYAQFSGVTWIGRYVLNGMAIADEFHASTPDGMPYLGVSLRQFDTSHHAWVIEYLNVTNSFLRRQVNPDSGSVTLQADTVFVVSADGQTRFRESYEVIDKDHFTYRADGSRDAGRNWDPISLEIALSRLE